jgi:hypothetical protein
MNYNLAYNVYWLAELGRYHLTHESLLWFCGSPWIFIQINNFFKLLAAGIEPLTLGLQVQHFSLHHGGLPATKLIISTTIN